MAVLGGGNTNRIQTNNKVAVQTGAYNCTIVDEWVHYVTKTIDGTWADGSPKFVSRFSKVPTDDREIKISITLDDAPEIAFEARMAAYVSEKSKLGKIIASLTGLEAGSDEMKKWDTKGLVGMKGVAELKFNGKEEAPYTRIVEIRARPRTLQPLPAPISNGQKQSDQSRPETAGIVPSPIPAEALAYIEPKLVAFKLSEDEIQTIAERVSSQNGFSTYQWKQLRTREIAHEFFLAAKARAEELKAEELDGIPF